MWSITKRRVVTPSDSTRSISDGRVIATALESDLDKEQFHVVFGYVLGATEDDLADNLGLDRYRVNTIKRTAFGKMRRKVGNRLNIQAAS